MDNAATTPVDRAVLKVMLPYLQGKFGNPSSIHVEGAEAKKALEFSRKKIALILQAHSDEIIFTSGGTESNNLAIFGVVRALEKTGTPISKMHFITSLIEHSSVLECFRELEELGAKVDYAPVKENGVIDPRVIAKLLKPETVLVSIGYANNEIGTIQPIREISKVLRNFPENKNLKTEIGSRSEKRRPVFHCDASQAPLYLDCMVTRLGVDLMTLDGHKMYGPKGVGFLYVKRGTRLSPILHGGGQERGTRSTTENVSGIVGLAHAFEIAAAKRKKESARLAKLRDYCYSNILQNIGIERVVVNGDLKDRLPNNINISIPGLDTEFAVLKLDAAGIACSTKSSCLGSDGGSYVVRALGRGGSAETRALSTLRFTFGRDTTKNDVNYLVKVLTKIAARLI